VRDRLMAHAVRRAYADSLPAARHPAYVLYLELDPAEVDVNVHPTKQEVRFREARLVHDFLSRALARALGSPGAAAPAPAPDAHDHVPRPALRQVHEDLGAYLAPAGPGRAEPVLGRAVTVLHGAFLLAQGRDGPVLVDLRAATERVLRARLLAGLAAGGLPSQPLLIPVAVPLNEVQAEGVEGRQEDLRRLGLDLVRSAPAVVSVHGLPAALRRLDPPALLARVLAQAWGGAAELAEALAREAAALGPVPAQDDLDALLRDLEACSRPGEARPWVSLGRGAIERLFAESRPG
jgi:DNA mismatch repair protein MutL